MREHHVTADCDKVPLFRKVSYGSGMLGFALLIQVYMQFYNPVYNDTLGLSPVWIGWVIFLSRLWDAFTDPMMGNLSDNTRSRWGRRRPWIALGAVLCALTFIALWWFPRGQSDTFYFVWLLGFSLLFYLAFTIFSVPYIALGMELSPDYHERTRVMTVRTVIEQFGTFIVASLFYLTSLAVFADRAEGMRYNSLWVGFLIFLFILTPAIYAREHPTLLRTDGPSTGQPATAKRASVSLIASMRATLSSWPFLNLGLITVISYFGVITVSSLNYYVITYYLFNGSKGVDAGKLLTVSGYCIPVSAMVALPLMNLLSQRIGKRHALMVAFSLTIVGALLRWPLYTPDHPYLSIIPTLLFGVGTAGAYLFINAMIPEAVDADELKLGQRREGMFSAIYGWTYKLGAALAILLSGYVLSWTGFQTNLVGPQSPETIFWLRFCFSFIAAIAMLITTALVLTYPITEQKAYEIRQQLAARKAGQV
jgi:glycoside/pentoside/hexuronide:cation symporter, GPH family